MTTSCVLVTSPTSASVGGFNPIWKTHARQFGSFFLAFPVKIKTHLKPSPYICFFRWFATSKTYYPERWFVEWCFTRVESVKKSPQTNPNHLPKKRTERTKVFSLLSESLQHFRSTRSAFDRKCWQEDARYPKWPGFFWGCHHRLGLGSRKTSWKRWSDLYYAIVGMLKAFR